jgi:hypothetical protein
VRAILRGIALVAAVLGPGCAPDPAGPGPTTELFWQALEAGDIAGAQALTDGAPLASVRDLEAAHPFEAIELGEALDNESRAQVPTRMQRQVGAGPDFSFHTHLSRGADGWRIDLRQTRRDLTRELLASSFQGVQKALRESGEAFIEEFEERALEVSEALRETLEELEKSLSEPEDPESLDP